jgi:hypothetical protein
VDTSRKYFRTARNEETVESPTTKELERAFNAIKIIRPLVLMGYLRKYGKLVESTSLRHCMV